MLARNLRAPDRGTEKAFPRGEKALGECLQVARGSEHGFNSLLHKVVTVCLHKVLDQT